VLQRVRGQLAAAQGRREDAAQFLRAAVNLFGEMGERFERGKSLTLLARIVTEPGEPRKLLYRASACFRRDRCRAPARRSREGAGRRRFHRHALRPCARTARATAVSRAASCRIPASSARRARWPASPDLVSRAAGTDLSVILVGETGTGKELVARGIHAQSRRAERAFIAVNCGALRPELALSQLFGHRRGAFTGAQADGVGFVEAAHTGTLFLDEIGELPADVQVTLLRFLESGEYLRLGETQVRRADVRIVGATHVDLRRAVAEKAFRADLFYRLHEVEIELPSLRERSEDVLPLARHFLRAYGGDPAPGIGEDTAKLLLAHPWPGNVRELENCIKRALALLPHMGDMLPAEALAEFFERTPMPPPRPRVLRGRRPFAREPQGAGGRGRSPRPRARARRGAGQQEPRRRAPRRLAQDAVRAHAAPGPRGGRAGVTFPGHIGDPR
jgi:DNA-binding NtrC family response regulator